MFIMKKIFSTVSGLVAFGIIILIPDFAMAQTGSSVINNWIKISHFVVQQLFPILIALAGLAFMVQIIRFLASQKSEDRDKLRKSVLSNLIILFVMVTVFGLIKILTSVFGLQIGTDIGLASGSGGSGGAHTFRHLVYQVTNFISKYMVPMAVAIASMTFLWNLVIYLTKTDNEIERTNARNYIMWSLLALAIMLTLFSILGTATQTLFGSSAFIPQFPTSASN